MKEFLNDTWLDLIIWHENLVEKWQDSLGWSHYSMLWAAFTKGLVIALLLTWIF